MSRFASGIRTRAIRRSSKATAGLVSYNAAFGVALGLEVSRKRFALVKLIFRCSARLHELMRVSYSVGPGDRSRSTQEKGVLDRL